MSGKLERKGSKIMSSPISKNSPVVNYRIANYPLSLVVEDLLAFSGLIQFSKKYHSAENLFFWAAAVAYRQRGEDKTLPRTKSMLMQEQIDLKEAQWRGATVQHVQILREALAVYDRFLFPDAPDWVCLPVDMVSKIEALIESARTAKKGKMPLLDYKLFQEAEKHAYMNVAHDTLPRWLKHLQKVNDVSMMRYLRELQKSRNGDSYSSLTPVTEYNVSDVMIQNAMSCLHPTPRAVLMNRPGSCLKEPLEPLEPAASSAEDSATNQKPRGFSFRALFSRPASASNASVNNKEQRRGSHDRPVSLDSKKGSKHGSSFAEDMPRQRTRSKSG